ncbi:sugar ABC transporter ATP-binding protein [Sedimentitalea todarodis]|uniref:Sugar ABC transporter ATP-binding protein n=1 Tax=Sedimentitalea todarodis TaxID=1631240 RepID=A0ABU3VEG4_9RHOB|nr:sugar ABC transporter ATP-binding protein [Sedimentitalea todarodis]MDU9004561.1 sugar ABC transporter ATP-binding protein [Sedimentitalea todarodis]
MQPLVSMQGIEKSFSGVPALRAADLELAPGEVHGLIGQNGAGKSTLIKILTGVYRRDAGTVRFDGQDSTVSSPREAQVAGIATIYQELNLVPLRSVTENVMMGYEPKRLGVLVDWNEAHRRTREILSRFGIDIDVRARLGSYSTAIQQLVAIARAVSLDARLVIMDEPTSSLDANEVKTLFGVVKSLKAAGVCVLYVSHFLDELFAVCDRVTTMRDGQTVGVRNIAETSKLELIADMLGRNVEDIQAAGMTEFGGGTKEPGEILLTANDISTGNRLRKFDLNVHRGEIVGLGGLLGSGRTEAARALFGVDPLTKGRVTFKGAGSEPENPAAAIAEGIGFLTEDRKSEGIIPDMSVRENLTLALLPKLTRNAQIDRKREQELVAHYIKSLGIKTSDMDQPIRELSGGNQQKVLLARWLATQPDLLILDEPTRGVDVGAKLEIQSIIRDYVDQGFGVVLISSEFEELVEGADRIVVLQDGCSVSELQNPGITENALVKAIAHHHDQEVSA